MKKSEGTRELESLASSQWGMFTTAQAQRVDVRRSQVARLVHSGRVEPQCYGVYRYVEGNEVPQADLKAHWLSVFPERTAAERLSQEHPDAVVAANSAVFARGAGDLHASPYTFIVSTRKQTTRNDMRYLSCRLDLGDVEYVGALPTTSVERTVHDLLRLGEDPSLVDGFIRDVVRNGAGVDRVRLGQLLSPLASANGFAAGDGQAFADSLLARDAVDIQAERAGRALAEALGPLVGRGDVQRLAELVSQTAMGLSPELSKAIDGISALCPSRETQEMADAVQAIARQMQSLADGSHTTAGTTWQTEETRMPKAREEVANG